MVLNKIELKRICIVERLSDFMGRGFFNEVKNVAYLFPF